MFLKQFCPAFIFVALIIMLSACKGDETNNSQSDTAVSNPSSAATTSQQFSLLDAAQTGIHFRNDIKETADLNYLRYLYCYNGAGVSIGDINNDGLEDLYFGSNMNDSKLYLNQGDFKFKDISQSAGIIKNPGWQTGSTMVDINGDGLLDIYQCVSGPDGYNKSNLLYINNGDGKFSESAAGFGLDLKSNSTQAAFLDFDLDGDLDVYIVNHLSEFPKRYDNQALNSAKDISRSDRLLRNDGNNFTDVTAASGILNQAFGLNASVADFNNDGYPDIYVTSDFSEPDYLYINQKNGRFKNEIKQSMGHISQYSMGSDAADINNDGLTDLMVLDMSPEDNYRHKMMMGAMAEDKFRASVAAGNHYQYMYNSLQLNRGASYFSEIAMWSGVATTDWSWCPLIADFDNDGLSDIYVTNGIKRDVLDNDYRFRITEKTNQRPGDVVNINVFEALDTYNSTELANYMFKNEGRYKFSKVASSWGLNHAGFSNGASYGDLDNDGDLDLIVNNVDGLAFVYKNNAVENKKTNNFIKIQLKGSGKNIEGLGASIKLKTNRKSYHRENYRTRGYLSSSSINHLFAFASGETVESIEVYWPAGSRTLIEKPDVSNVTIVVNESDGQAYKTSKSPEIRLLTPIPNSGIGFKHNELAFNDMAREILIPHKLSSNGPCITSADINGDGLQDVFIGNGAGGQSEMYTQSKSGKFTLQKSSAFRGDQDKEDTDACFFDFDGDGDLDLYVASGSNERQSGSEFYQDRLYINDGKGNFTRNIGAFPDIRISSSVVKAHDYDGDGDQDLFVGGGNIPSRYGHPSRSYLLRNDGGKLVDVTESVCQEMLQLGMVNDALWTDIDQDNQVELIIVGEWMPISIFEFADNKFVNRTQEYNLHQSTGWWNTIEQADIDNDGDMDYVLGNLGLNYKFQASQSFPFEMYANDFDGNDSEDIVLSYYQDGMAFPVRGRNCSMQQMPGIQQQFPNYESFARANLQQIYGDKLSTALKKNATTFASVILENQGNGMLKIRELPTQAQLSAIRSIAISDINKDGNQDVILAGNWLDAEAETPRADASYGLILFGNGDFSFRTKPLDETNFRIVGEVHDLEIVELANKSSAIMVGINKNKLRVFGFK